MLRKEPSGRSDDDVWLDNEAEVETGQTVELLDEANGFSLVRTSDGDEGYIRSGYLHGTHVISDLARLLGRTLSVALVALGISG